MKLIAILFAIVLLIVANLARASEGKFQVECWSDSAQDYIVVKMNVSYEEAEELADKENRDCRIQEM